LIEQRKNRPSSPHLTIYQPQLTWYLSSVHRVSGIVLAAGFYGVTISYALGSLIGYPLDSTMLAELFHSLPTFAQVSAKVLPGMLFFFHCTNGVRHLIWDAGKELTIKGVYRTGYAVLAATSIATLFYSFF
jgi:succinate dehydrogenase (ubiquinone) cytochrome b560 subunit